MIAAIDFGSVLNKALVFNEGEFKNFKFSLSYTEQKFTRRSLWEAVKMVENLSGHSLLGALNKPLDKIYVATSLPLTNQFEPGELATKVVSTKEVAAGQTAAVLDVGFKYISFSKACNPASFESSEALKWLPFKSTLTELENYLENRRIYSHVLPIFPRDLYFEQAIAREKVIQFFNKYALEAPLEITLSGGIFCASPYPSQSLLLLMDSLSGNFKKIDVYMDKTGFSVPLGLLRMFETEVFEKAAPLFVPEFLGSFLRFDREVTLSISLGLSKPLLVKVERGRIFNFPLSPGETAKVSVSARGLKDESFDLTGGSLGAVFDGRERDLENGQLVLPNDAKTRQNELKEWERSLGATGRLGHFG
ncbi:MAG: hypothetical protein M1352_02005 [Patescibacteria group bacterium]|nr:hypothetical protein [Patescibacteria group bacterium]